MSVVAAGWLLIVVLAVAVMGTAWLGLDGGPWAVLFAMVWLFICLVADAGRRLVSLLRS